ncbi:MAG: hypothetical protein FJ090_20590 [Deltaproteobacteria bacterium]|nr:hypothetical protein [Deltaproteobacteria bacterium]
MISLLAGLAVVGPAMVAGGLAGSPGAEVYGHAWVQWWASAGWPGWPTGTDLAAGTASWPVIDPLPTWVAAGLARGVGHAWAWNGLAFAGVVVTSLGGARLCRAMGGSEHFGALATPLMAIYLGSVQSGLTEDYFLGLVAFAIACALEGRWVRAGLLAGITAGFGLYLGWMAAVGVAAAWSWRRPGLVLAAPSWRAALPGVLGIALAGAGMLAFAAPFQTALSREVGRPPAAAEPLWQLNPWRGADLASFVVPGRPDTGGAIVREHPSYVGYATLGLAAAGGWHPAMLAVAALVAVAPGDELSFAGEPLGVKNPVATLFHSVPGGDRFRNHARLMLLGQLVLVGLASRGAARWRWAGMLVVAEAVLLSPARVSVTPVEAPAVYDSLPPGQATLRVVGEKNPQKPFFDQRFHGRKLANNPNRPEPGPPRAGEVLVVFDGEGGGRVVAGGSLNP